VTWVRLDDGWGDDPNMVAAGPIALALAVWATCWSSRHLTDGRVPVGALAGCPWVSKRAALDRACEKLESAGFWTRIADAYELTDPFAFLEKADVVRDRREQAAERKRRQRDRDRDRVTPMSRVTGNTRHATPDPTRENGVSTETPVLSERARSAALAVPGSPPLDDALHCPFCDRVFDEDDYRGRADHIRTHRDALALPPTFTHQHPVFPLNDIHWRPCDGCGADDVDVLHDDGDLVCTACLLTDGKLPIAGLGLWDDDANEWRPA